MRIAATVIALLVLTSVGLTQALYRLKAGDTVEIWVEQDPNLRRQVKIAPDGRISLPQAGHIRAAGLTPEGLEKAIADRVGRNFTSPVDVTVIVTEAAVSARPARVTRIFVTGEVAKPGAFTITQPTTVLQGIALAGGLGDFAAKKRVIVRRFQNGREIVIPFNYRDAEQLQDMPDHVYLKDGDVIVVPERRLFE